MALFSTLSDNFDDNSFDTGIWGRTDATYVKEQNQRIEFSNIVGLNAIQYFYSLSTYDLTGSYVLAKITNYSGVTAGIFDIGTSTGQTFNSGLYNSLIFRIAGPTATATLQALYTNGGVITTVRSGVSYNTSTHIWFRIRESGGTIYWDTSDGTTWTNFTSVATPITITSLYYVNQAVNSTFLSSRTAAYVDFVNLGDTATTSTSTSSSTSSTSSSTSSTSSSTSTSISTSTSSTSSSTSASTSTSQSTSSTSSSTSASTSTSFSSTSTSTTQSFTTSTSSTSSSTSSTSSSTSISTSTSLSTSSTSSSTSQSTTTSSTSTSASTSTSITTSTSTSTSSTSVSTSSTSTSISTSTSTTIAPDLREKGFIKHKLEKPRVNVSINQPKTKHLRMLIHRINSKNTAPSHKVNKTIVSQSHENKPPKTR